jgi:hypothetical protein
MTKDDRDSVNSNLESLGPHGAMVFAERELSRLKMPQPPNHRRRRILILTVREAAKRVQLDVQRARRLAACHTSGLRSIGVKVMLLLALASTASAQTTVVYTNIVDGQRIGSVVKVVRAHKPAIAVPSSIVTTPTFDRAQFIDDLLRRSTPPSVYIPTPPLVSERRVYIPRVPQPFFYNGIYMGPSPSGQWTSVTQGTPRLDVHIVGTQRVRIVNPPVITPQQRDKR